MKRLLSNSPAARHARLATPALIAAACVLLSAAPPAETAGEVYGTWGGFLEVDRCAAAWVIDRFVEGPGVFPPAGKAKSGERAEDAPSPAARGLHARFRFFKPGEVIRGAVAFDVPDARRYARRPGTCIMETVLAAHDLDAGDPALLEVARVVRDAELNKWSDRVTPEAAGVERVIRGLNELSRDEMDCLRRSFDVFDALYAAFRARTAG